MHKIIVFIVFFLARTEVMATLKNHLSELNSKFPYGLIGDDYGILKPDDLKINASNAEPVPFDPKKQTLHPYQYWKCFKSKSVSLYCESNDQRAYYEGAMGLIVFKVKSQNESDTYSEARLWPINDCLRFIRDAKSLLNDSSHVCFSGVFISQELNENGDKEFTWSFEKIKTKKGCEGRQCEVSGKEKED